MSKRFFSFGCSMTSFAWPSWADLIAYHNGAEKYYNCGKPGVGNRVIMQMVFEADEICKFTHNDTVLVMITSPWRNDTFIRGEWQPRGSVYNDAFGDHYTPDWMSKFWSEEMGLMNTWLAVKSIREFLTSKGVNFKILPALPYNVQPAEFYDGAQTEFDVSFYINGINAGLDVKHTLWDHAHQADIEHLARTKYWFDDMQCYDVHPTIVEHAEYVRLHLPEYYNAELEASAQVTHALIEKESHLKNYFKPELSKYRGIQLGSLTYVYNGEKMPTPNFLQL